MNKIFRANNKIIWVIPAYGLIPIIDLLSGKPYTWETLLRTIVYLLVSINAYFFSRRKIAEIKDGVLHIYSGIGLNDPSNVLIKQIDKIERGPKSLLLISYDGTKTFSIEAGKKTLNQMEREINKLIKT